MRKDFLVLKKHPVNEWNCSIHKQSTDIIVNIDRIHQFQPSFKSVVPEFQHILSDVGTRDGATSLTMRKRVCLSKLSIEGNLMIRDCHTSHKEVLHNRVTSLRFWNYLQVLLNTWWSSFPDNIYCMLNMEYVKTKWTFTWFFISIVKLSIQPVFDSITNSLHGENIDDHCWGIFYQQITCCWAAITTHKSKVLLCVVRLTHCP